jgi:hypothetical protein
MRKTKITPEEESKKQYEELLEELLREEGKQISQRNQEHFDETLKLFERAGYTKIQHRNWRDTEMVWTMFRLIVSRHRQLNPRKYEEYRYEDDPELEIEQKEIYPGLDRRELEIFAADQYLAYNTKTGSKAEVKGPKGNKGNKKEKNTPVENRKGNLPEINLGDLTKTGLSDKQVVDDWLKKNPDKVDIDGKPFPADLQIMLSKATSRTKANLRKKGLFKLPMRCQKTKAKESRWHGYALIEEGSVGGKGTGNKYGIIREDLDA